MLQEKSVINERYEIICPLGKGGYGQVYKVWDLVLKKAFALKIDINDRFSVYQESKILKDLQGGKGIPILYQSGKLFESTYMILELLGQNFWEIRKSIKSWNTATLSYVLIQILESIQFLHSKGYIHRDIKPQNILLGENNLIYLVDFGISKKFIINNNHIFFQTQCPRIGSPSYASINSHSGIRLSRRDDLESFVYLAVFLVQGTLPWSEKDIDSQRKWNYAFMLKKEISEDKLFEGCPKQLATFLSYVRALKFDDKPDYAYLKKLVNFKNLDFVDGLISTKPKDFLMHTGKKRTMANEKSQIKLHKLKPKRTLSLLVSKKSHKKNLFTVEVSKTISAIKLKEMLKKSFDDLDATIKDTFPEFINRKNLFKKYSEFFISEECQAGW